MPHLSKSVCYDHSAHLMVRESESWEGRNDKLGFRQVVWLSQESCTWNVRMVVEENDKDYQATQIFMQWESSLKNTFTFISFYEIFLIYVRLAFNIMEQDMTSTLKIFTVLRKGRHILNDVWCITFVARMLRACNIFVFSKSLISFIELVPSLF